jgi:hypothetical protein
MMQIRFRVATAIAVVVFATLAGLGTYVGWVAFARGQVTRAQAASQAPANVLSDQQLAKVLAQSGSSVLTERDMQDTLLVDSSVLDTPLIPAEVEESRQNILGQFQRNPEAGSKGLAEVHKLAEIMRHGSQSESLQLGVALWSRWVARASDDPSVKRWVEIVIRHNPPIVSSEGLVVTQRQLAAMFVSNDWVAQTAQLPTSTPESRAAFARELPSKFPSMTHAEKEQLALADRRWTLLQDPIMDHSDLHAKAVSLVHQNVHGSADVPTEARALEDAGIQFNAEMAQFVRNMGQISGISTSGQMNTNAINFASRKFLGEGR